MQAKLSWLFNCLVLQSHFDDNFLDRRRPINCHSWTVGIMRGEDSELSGMHDEMIALRIKEIHVIFRTIFHSHDVIQWFTTERHTARTANSDEKTTHRRTLLRQLSHLRRAGVGRRRATRKQCSSGEAILTGGNNQSSEVLPEIMIIII